MADTRMLPKKVTRSTGIDRTTHVTSRPNNAAGNNATSHVSAAPGVSAAAHAHVVQARNPAGVNRPAPQRSVGGSLVSGGGNGRAAKVEIFPSVMSDAGRGARSGAQRPTVQVIEAPRGGSEAIATGLPPVPAFSLQQMLLVASLLEQYEEKVSAIGDVNNQAIARGALAVLQEMHAWSTRPSPRHPAATLPVPPARAHVEIVASTSTTIIGPPIDGRGTPDGSGAEGRRGLIDGRGTPDGSEAEGRRGSTGDAPDPSPGPEAA
jgi:hypothetical protein